MRKTSMNNTGPYYLTSLTHLLILCLDHDNIFYIYIKMVNIILKENKEHRPNSRHWSSQFTTPNSPRISTFKLQANISRVFVL